jgi:hypothetical protein
VQHARVIPVSGITNDVEAEQRATSAFLAVLSVVRDLSVDLLTPLGASRAQRAIVETFTEVRYKVDGKTVQPDGLIRVQFGNSTWSSFVEVKTSDNLLSAEQINLYWDLARTEHIDHVLTISNEIGPVPTIHPTPGLKVRANSPVQVSHLSWPAILTTAIRIKQHRGVSDPEQAWILNELIRYLEHPASGALAFGDMGPSWVEVRDGVRAGTLNRKHDGVADVAARFDQLLRFGALKLGAEIGQDVEPLLAKAQRDPKTRLAYMTERLARDGSLDGTLRIPNTAGDLTLTADLRSHQVVASVDLDAPDDRGGKARATWLVTQLKDARGDLQIESFPKGARSGTTTTLASVREDRAVVIDSQGRDPARFRVTARTPMGLGRKAGTRSPGFIDSFLGLLTDFYASVVQNIAAWQPKAPQLKREVTQEAAPTAEHDPVPPSPAPEAASDPSAAGDSSPV